MSLERNNDKLEAQMMLIRRRIPTLIEEAIADAFAIGRRNSKVRSAEEERADVVAYLRAKNQPVLNAAAKNIENGLHLKPSQITEKK